MASEKVRTYGQQSLTNLRVLNCCAYHESSAKVSAQSRRAELISSADNFARSSRVFTKRSLLLIVRSNRDHSAAC